MAGTIHTINAGLGPQPLFGRQANLVMINKRTNQRLDVSGLRFVFNFERSATSDPNSGTIQVYNLASKSRAFCDIPPEKKGVLTKNGLFVELSAGYQGLVRRILTGNATGRSEYQGPDWVTSIDVLDGGTALRTTTIHKSYGPGFSVNRIIHEVAESFELPIGYIKPVITDDVVQHGLTLDGLNRKILSDFGRRYKFSWCVDNGAINLVDRNLGLPQPAVNLSPKTGLIGSPIKTDKGVNFKCLIIPLIVPECKVRLSGNSIFNGEVLVQRIRYSGDTHGDDWSMDVEATI